MIVCLCEGVSDSAIRSACHEGASSLKAVAKRCGAGTGCGACHQQIYDIMQSQGASHPAPRPSVATRGSLPVLILGG